MARKLAYATYGKPDGTPVFFFHGNPGSKVMKHPDDSIIDNLNIRLIAADRPGYGQSDFQKNRVLLDWADDVDQLADALNIDKFYVMGVSAGGPYTAAVAYKLANRVIAAAIVSGASPVDRPGAYEGMNETYQKAFKSAGLPEWLLKILVGIQRRNVLKDIDKSLDERTSYLSENDRKLMALPDYRQNMIDFRRDAYHQGVQGMVREAKILVAPWGFDPANISRPVHLWYWADDTLVPQQMGRYLESKIQNTIPHFHDAGGHFSIYDHWQEILETLLQTDS